MSNIPKAHDHLVLDIAYDFYGERMATCSLDKKIKVWERAAASPSTATANGGDDSHGFGWRKKGETVLNFVPCRIAWAHPE